MIPPGSLLFLLTCAVCPAILGCRHAGTSQLSPSTTQRSRINITAKPMESGNQEMKDKFRANLPSLGVLAIKIDVENNEDDGLSLGRGGVALVSHDGTQMPAIRIEPRKPGPKGAGIVFAAIFDHSPDRKVRSNCSEWNNYGLPASLDIPPHATESRFAYFDFRDKEGKPLKIQPMVYRLSITLSHDAGELETFQLPIMCGF